MRRKNDKPLGDRRDLAQFEITDDVTPPALAAALAANSSLNEGLNAKVLVLNKLYVAVRVVSARRAFSLLFRDIAEVIHVERGVDGPDGAAGSSQFVNYDFESWAEIAALQRQYEHD